MHLLPRIEKVVTGFDVGIVAWIQDLDPQGFLVNGMQCDEVSSGLVIFMSI